MSTIYVDGGAGDLPNDFVDPSTNTTFSYDPSASTGGSYAYTDPATDYGYSGTDFSAGGGTTDNPYAWSPDSTWSADSSGYDSSGYDSSAGTGSSVDYSASAGTDSTWSAADSTDYSSGSDSSAGA